MFGSKSILAEACGGLAVAILAIVVFLVAARCYAQGEAPAVGECAASCNWGGAAPTCQVSPGNQNGCQKNGVVQNPCVKDGQDCTCQKNVKQCAGCGPCQQREHSSTCDCAP
jgi:hypothetical protein